MDTRGLIQQETGKLEILETDANVKSYEVGIYNTNPI